MFENVLSVHIKCYNLLICLFIHLALPLVVQLKQTVDRYTQSGSHVFASFLDFSKVFDKVGYWKLFHKLLDDGIDVGIVRLLAFWYSHHSSASF